MHKLLMIIALFMGAILVSTGPVGADGGPPKDFVAGGGQHLADGIGPQVNAFHVSAHATSSKTPAAAKGSFHFKNTGVPFASSGIKAKVTCLYVVGNQAFVTGTMTTPATGDPVLMHVVDNEDGPDLVRVSFKGAIYPIGEGCYAPFLPPVEVTSGNVVVNDAP